MSYEIMKDALPGLWLAIGIGCFLVILLKNFDPRANKDHERNAQIPFQVEDRIDG